MKVSIAEMGINFLPFLSSPAVLLIRINRVSAMKAELSTLGAGSQLDVYYRRGEDPPRLYAPSCYGGLGW